MFGIDDALLGAGANFLGGIVNNMIAGNNAANQGAFNRDSQIMSSLFNAEQANIARQFSREQADVAQARNVDVMHDAQRFNSAEAVEAFRRNVQAMHDQQAYNSGEAAIARDWNERMSSTAYQRTMKDMKSAGMNPILAYRQGATGNPAAAVASSGAASGPGASSSSPTASPGSSFSASSGGMATQSMAQVFDTIQPAVSTALSIKRLENETKLNNAQVAQVEASTATEKVRPENVRAGTAKTEQEYNISKYKEPTARVEGEKAKIEEDMLEKAAYRALLATGLVTGNSAKVVGDVMSPIPGIAVLKNAFGKRTREGSRQYAPDGKSFDEFYSSTGR